MSNSATVRDALLSDGFVAIIRIDDQAHALATAEHLARLGVKAIEFSLANTDLSTLEQARGSIGSAAFVGAGTVLTQRQAHDAVSAGAQLLVSPDLNEDVVRFAQDRDVLHMPGVLTPNEAAAAARAGSDLIKLFPAGRLGASYMGDILAAMPGLKLMPTGGIDLDNASAFVQAGCAALGLGSSLVGRGGPSSNPDALTKSLHSFRSLLHSFKAKGP